MRDYYDAEEDLYVLTLSENNGFSIKTYDVKMTFEKYSEAVRVNSFGYSFLKHEGKTYIKHPINGSYDLITSERQLDEAFNPEKYEIMEWLKN